MTARICAALEVKIYFNQRVVGDAGMMGFMNENIIYKGISVEPVSLLIGTALAFSARGVTKA